MSEGLENEFETVREELEAVAEAAPWRNRDEHIPAFAALTTIQDEMKRLTVERDAALQLVDDTLTALQAGGSDI